MLTAAAFPTLDTTGEYRKIQCGYKSYELTMPYLVFPDTCSSTLYASHSSCKFTGSDHSHINQWIKLLLMFGSQKQRDKTVPNSLY